MLSIYDIIYEIPDEQRTQVILALPYLENITDGRERAAILVTLSRIPERERSSDVINKLLALCNGITNWSSLDDMVSILREIWRKEGK